MEETKSNIDRAVFQKDMFESNKDSTLLILLNIEFEVANVRGEQIVYNA